MRWRRKGGENGRGGDACFWEECRRVAAACCRGRFGQSVRMKNVRAWLGLAVGLIGAGAPVVVAAESTALAAEKNTIAGLTIPRPTGEFLGLEVADNHFVLTFYDAKKVKKPVDVVRATLRWPVRYQPNDERLVLNPGGDGTSLTSARVIRPPHNFRVAIGLFVEGSDDPVEFYNVNYP